MYYRNFWGSINRCLRIPATQNCRINFQTFLLHCSSSTSYPQQVFSDQRYAHIHYLLLITYVSCLTEMFYVRWSTGHPVLTFFWVTTRSEQAYNMYCLMWWKGKKWNRTEAIKFSGSEQWLQLRNFKNVLLLRWQHGNTTSGILFQNDLIAMYCIAGSLRVALTCFYECKVCKGIDQIQPNTLRRLFSSSTASPLQPKLPKTPHICDFALSFLIIAPKAVATCETKALSRNVNKRKQ